MEKTPTLEEEERLLDELSDDARRLGLGAADKTPKPFAPSGLLDGVSISLHTADPGPNMSENETSYAGYVRQRVMPKVMIGGDGAVTMHHPIYFPQVTESTTFTHAVLHKDGEPIFAVQLRQPTRLMPGDVLEFKAGTIDVSVE